VIIDLEMEVFVKAADQCRKLNSLLRKYLKNAVTREVAEAQYHEITALTDHWKGGFDEGVLRDPTEGIQAAMQAFEVYAAEVSEYIAVYEVIPDLCDFLEAFVTVRQRLKSSPASGYRPALVCD